MTVVCYTPEQMGAIRRRIRQEAEATFARYEVPDPDGRAVEQMVRYGLDDLDEWARVLGFR